MGRRRAALAAECEQLRGELERARRRLDDVEALSRVGSWEWDLEGDRFECSAELRRIYGIAADAPVGSHHLLVDCVFAKDRGAVSEALERAVDARRGFNFTHRIVRGDGAVRWLQVSARMNDRADRLPHLGGTARDVTESHLAQERLESSNEDLERYAYVISHDLSEPARAMAGFARLLDRRNAPQLDTDGRRFVRSIIRGADRMEDLIHALLAYARVGSERIQSVDVDLNAVARDVLEGLARSIIEKHAVVEAGDLPTVRGDPVLLAQLLQNLIANAIKFGGEDSPRVEVSAARGQCEWTIEVRDNGVGIDPRQASRVWGIFERLHDGSQPGTGVGLAICKRIVERHGGHIWVEPAPGGGSAFGFSLPDPVHDSGLEPGEPLVVFSAPSG